MGILPTFIIGKIIFSIEDAEAIRNYEKSSLNIVKTIWKNTDLM